MGKFVNLPDALLIGFSAYLVIWGVNWALRNMNMAEFQA